MYVTEVQAEEEQGRRIMRTEIEQEKATFGFSPAGAINNLLGIK